MPDAKPAPLTTPDGRYIIVNGRLWRATNPTLLATDRSSYVKDLMAARREIYRYRDDPQRVRAARARVQQCKEALGERGPPWWSDGAPDYNRRLVSQTPYRTWFEQISSGGREPDPPDPPDPENGRAKPP